MQRMAMRELSKGERGYILIVGLLVLLVVGLISGPLLSFMVNGLVAGHTFEVGADELYGADAGVQDAVWKIQQGVGLCPGNPSTHYTISDVNGNDVGVTLTYVNDDHGILYRVNSITASDNSHTEIESYIRQVPPSELAIFSGILSSKGDITWISHGSTVTGDIYYCGTLDPDFIHISGDEIKVGLDAFPTQGQDLAFALALKAEAMAGGTHNGDMNIDTNVTLNSMYISGNLNINSDFTLAGIVYVKGSISASKDIIITGAASSIALVAEGSMTFEKCGTAGNTDSFILMSLSSNGIDFKKEATLGAMIYAPNGPIYFNKEAAVTGSIIGADITVKKDASLTYVGKGGGFDLPGGFPGRAVIETYAVSRS
jgi:hypothetical protein